MPLFARKKTKDKGKKNKSQVNETLDIPAPRPRFAVWIDCKGEHVGVPAARVPDLSSGTMRERRGFFLCASLFLLPLFFSFWIQDGVGAGTEAVELGLDWGGRKGEHTSVTGQSQPLDQS